MLDLSPKEDTIRPRLRGTTAWAKSKNRFEEDGDRATTFDEEGKEGARLMLDVGK